MTKRKLAREHPALDHDGAMDMLNRAGTVALLSYEEAVAAYLRARHILVDDAECLGDPVPADWTPPPPATLEDGPEYHRRNPHYATGADLDAIAESVGGRRAWSEPDDEFRPRVVTAWTARPPIPRTPGASLIEALSQRTGVELDNRFPSADGFRHVRLSFRDAETARRFMALLRVGAPEREG